MAASVTVLWLVAAFLGGAFSLTCHNCNTTGNNCEGGDKICEGANDACISTLTEIRQGDKATQQNPFKQLVKSCGDKKFCNHNYSMTFGNIRLSASSTCCYTDRCKAVMPEVKLQTPEKKQTCPYCGEPLTKCSDTEKTSCFGEEETCMSYTSKNASNPNIVYTWKGCATQNVCSMDTVATVPMNHVMVTKFNCNRAPSLLPGLLLPAAFGLVLLKLLL